MKFSEKWLREWVNPAVSTEQLAHQITMAGLEVDGVEPVAGQFSGVIIGEVVECGPHPDADKLQVTKINVGQDELIDIVCGAPNCRQGLKVAVAMVGAVLPGDFKIKKAKLRGQPSFGMLCSNSELQLSDDHDGIIELPLDAPIGVDIRDYLQLDDSTIEVDLTPNRADCLGIRGLAREVGVLNQAAVTAPQVEPVAASIDDKRGIKLSAPQACPRYLGRVIKGINLNTATPLWLKEKLRRCGVRSIDPVVDVTNFVLLEMGHPMHAFDLSKIEGEIDVRLANDKEKLVLLDGNEVELKSDTLVIADDNKALAMAGIFGGLDSGVTANSSDIFLESAFFAPLAITGRARQYGLHTDASHRYERGVDPQLQRTAMERATALLLSIVGGQAGPIVEAVDEQFIPQAAQVVLRQARLFRLLGVEIAPEQVQEILQRLGFDVQSNQTDSGLEWHVTVPTYRFDISIEEDLIEEVARVYGYNNITDQAPLAHLQLSTRREAELPLNMLKQTMINRGYQEAITYSFVDPAVQSALFPNLPGLVLPHPISSDMSVMRVSLWTGLLQAVSYNQKRQQGRIRLFETGLRFIPDQNAENGVRQEAMIAGGISGSRHGEHWDLGAESVDFYDIKADVEMLLANTANSGQFSFKAAQHSALHPGQTAEIYCADELVGYVGAVHPQFDKKLGLNAKVLAFELYLDKVSQRQLPSAKEISKYPANKRDIAIVVDEQIAIGEILSTIEKCSVNQLVGLNLFDVYKGKGVADGKKSLAISLTLQDSTKTLEEQEIQAMVNDIVSVLSEKFDASLRE
ncbi:phenylalanine--tRNA ligase subunit beta [Neptunicella sp.]|uniref:phenylalanine--tRNA ligase subunit beta n=1 Tax=Neptunicella sp. TaxID=2125986 RepID=UPI003F691AD2